MQGNPHFVAKDETGKALDAQEWGKDHAIDHQTAMRFVVTWLESKIAGMRIVAGTALLAACAGAPAATKNS